MRSQRPGLIVLGLLLLAGLGYLLWPTAAPTPEVGAGDRETTRGGAQKAAAQESDAAAARRDGAKTGDEAREDVPGNRRYALRGQLIRRGETPFTNAEVVAYGGTPHDRRLNMMSLMSSLDQDGAVDPLRLTRKLGKPIARTTVRTDGSFAFVDLPIRHLALTVEDDFYGLGQPEVVHIDPQQDRLVTLQPYVGGHIVGRIQPSRPSTGETVQLISEMDPMSIMQNPQDLLGYMMNMTSRTSPVEDAGRFEFRAVMATSQLNLTYRGKRHAALLGPISIRSGQRREVVLRAVECGTLAVLATGLGKPLEHARIHLIPKESRGQNFTIYSNLHGESDADGRCSVASLLPGSYRVDIDHEDFVGSRSTVLIKPGEATRLTVDLDGGGSVRGKVVDPDGQPVVGAAVAYMPNVEVPILGDLTEAMGKDVAARSAKGKRRRSDENGQFVITGILDDGEFVVTAWHDDFTGGLTKGVRVSDNDVVVVLNRPTTIRGRVVDDVSGEPLEDFTVQTLVRMMMVIERATNSTFVTGRKDGTFELHHVPPGKSTLRVQAQGYGDVRVPVTIASKNAPTRIGFGFGKKPLSVEEGGTLDVGEIRMRKGATVRGVVTTDKGEVVAGATVGRKMVGLLGNPMLQSMFGSGSTTTDDKGRFELTGLPPGRMALKAASTKTASGVSKRLELAPGQVVEGVEIVLASGGSIDGKLELTAGMSYDGWMVTVANQVGGSLRTGLVDTTGAFRFDGIDPGRYDVQAMQLDWMRGMQSEKMGMFRPGQKVDIAKLIKQAQQQLVMNRCRVKDGEVTKVVLDGSDLGEDGVALSIHVTLGAQPMKVGWLEFERLIDGRITMTVIQDGKADIDAVQPGGYRLVVRTGMSMTPVGDPIMATVPKGKSCTIPVRLAGGRVEGRVIDAANAEPLSHAVVRIVSAKGSEADQIEEIGYAITNDDGEFRFIGLADGKYSLFANDSFFNLTDKKHGGRLDNLRISGGGAVERVVLRARQAARAVVRVTDGSGLAVGRTMILAVDPGGKPLSTLPTFTDKDGHATLNGLPPGAMRVVGMTSRLAPGYSDVQEIQTAAKAEFLVTMIRGPRVKVRVEDSAGKPVVGARFSARWKGGPWIPISLIQRYEPKTGYVDLGHLPARAVEFRVHSPGFKPFVVQRTLPSGTSVEMVFTAPE